MAPTSLSPKLSKRAPDEAPAPMHEAALVDAGAAAMSAAMIAPFITLVDKAVVQSAAGVKSLGAALRESAGELVTKPHVYLRRPEVWLVAGVYGCTYAAANLTDSLCERLLDTENDPNAATKHEVARFSTTTATNMTASLLKDAAFARLFGKTGGGAPAPVPFACYALFAARDCATIASAFTVPRALAPMLSGAMGMAPGEAQQVIQIASPIASQVLCTPIHLLALDVYNRPSTAGGPSRAAAVAGRAASTTLARMGRMAPAYGLGGVTNTYLTSLGHDYVNDRAHAREAAAAAAAAEAKLERKRSISPKKLARTRSLAV